MILLPVSSFIKMVRKEEINGMMGSKFEKLKVAFIGEAKEIFISSVKKEMKTLFAEELANFKEEVYKNMDEITSTNKMQQHVTSLKRSNKDLIIQREENEQYGRRLCLIVKVIPRKEK